MNASPRASVLSGSAVAMPGRDLVDWRTDTLVDLLHRRAVQNPDLVLYTYLEDGETRERSINAAELDASIRRIGQTLSKFVKPGERVILLFEDGLDYISGLFGCLSAGLVAVSGIHPAAPRSAERLLGIARDCGATAVLGQAHVLAEFQRALDDVLDDFDLRWVASDMIKPVAAGAWSGTPAANGELALIQYTSGSSREPRGVMLSHRNVLHNLLCQFEAFGLQPGDTGVSWLPFSHDMGLIGCVLMAIYGGGRCILLSPSHFLEDPLRWPRAISRYRATLSAGPNFAYELCHRRAEEPGKLQGLDLSCWAVAVNGAEPIRPEVLRRFADVFAPAGFKMEALHPSYGLAEATLLVATGGRLVPFETRMLDRASLQANQVVPLSPDDAKSHAMELVNCGMPRPDQHLAIVDPETGKRIEQGRIGEIWIAGPSVSKGYFGRAEDNASYFMGDLEDGQGPYYKTGDLGFLLNDALFVTGRLRDLIIIRGKNYYPQDFERSAELSHPSVRPDCSASFIEEATGWLVIVVELNRAYDEDLSAICITVRDAIIRDHGVNPQRVVLTPWGSAFKTPSGKIQRAQTRAAYAEGRIAILHESVISDQLRMSKAREAVDFSKVEDWFLIKMREMGVDIASFDPEMRLTDLGFDSLRIVELKAELEQDLGIAINIADLYAFQDLQSLADHLRSLTGAKQHEPQSQPAVTAPAVQRNRLAEQRGRRGALAAVSGGPVSL
jgi:acyl-CoA synthetase (AMP-forming)/AMP-acid ligase II/acyl carrier protein